MSRRIAKPTNQENDDEIPKRPLEFYGIAVTDPVSSGLRSGLQREECPFLHRRCIKQRKSDNKQTIGACIVGYKNQSSLVICPHRFLQSHTIFLDCISLLEAKGRYFVVPEIAIPGGSVDYFLLVKRGGEIVDYLGIEIQSLDTTGSGGIWSAREDVRQGRLSKSYSYGINWKMSAKTILIQMSHKAGTFEDLGKKLVLVVQDEFLEYIKRNFAAGHLRRADDSDPVRIHGYECVAFGDALSITQKRAMSTSASGVDKMLKLGASHSVSDEEMKKKIESRMDQAFEIQVFPRAG